MPPAGFDPAIPASERTQTYALDRAGTGIGLWHILGKAELVPVLNEAPRKEDEWQTDGVAPCIGVRSRSMRSCDRNWF